MFRRQTPSSERSAEERVRAAAERAARRAAREGRPVEPPPPETFGARYGNGAPDFTDEDERDLLPETPGVDAAPETTDAPDPVPETPPVFEPVPETPPAQEPPTQAAPAASAAPPAYEPPPADVHAPAYDEPPADVREPPTEVGAPAHAAPPAYEPPPEPEAPVDDEPPAYEPEPAEAAPAPAAHAAPPVDEPATEVHAPAAPSPYEPQHYTAPPAEAQDDAVPEPDPHATQQWEAIPETAGPDDRTSEWAMPAAPDPPPPAPSEALPAVPLRPAGPPQRGARWRPERGKDRLAPTRPLAVGERNGGGATAGAPVPGERRGPRRAVVIAALVIIAVLAYVLNATFQPFHGDGKGAVAVTIPARADAGTIGDVLEQRGVIGSSRFFVLNATITGRRGGLRPGDYTLPKDMSNGAAIDALTRGPRVKAVKTFKLTIPEGRTAAETAPKLKEDGIEGDYLKATRSPALLKRARKLGLPSNARTLEGYLFPATYTLPEGSDARDIVERQLTGYRDNTADVDYARARRGNLTRYDVAIIASMIEREVQIDRERPLVAAVIYNRLKQGIPLGIDATIRYATDNWTRPIRQSELAKDGPYNTRLRRGLPPTPIGNPGLASIQAAAKPAKVDYLYYVVKPDGKGEHAFSSTDAEFQRDVARYNAARDANGGQAP